MKEIQDLQKKFNEIVKNKETYADLKAEEINEGIEILKQILKKAKAIYKVTDDSKTYTIISETDKTLKNFKIMQRYA